MMVMSVIVVVMINVLGDDTHNRKKCRGRQIVSYDDDDFVSFVRATDDDDDDDDGAHRAWR